MATGTDIGEAGSSVGLLAYEPDGRRLWCVTDREVQRWDIQLKQKSHNHPLGEQRSFPAPSHPSLSADARTLITSDRDNRDNFYVKLWDLKTGRLMRQLRVSGSMQYQRNAVQSPNGILEARPKSLFFTAGLVHL